MGESGKAFPYWLSVEAGKLIKFADLDHMIAAAMHPGEEALFAYGGARVNLEASLPKAVEDGELHVRNPLDMGFHTFPVGDALRRSVLMTEDLRPFLEARGIELRLLPYGSGPQLWTVENAALAIATQEGWHNGARATLLDQMMEAATLRHLVVRHPHTDLPLNAGPIRQDYELVTPDDVNRWLENVSAPYRWDVSVSVPLPAKVATETLRLVPNSGIPGTTPRTGAAKLAVTAAWELEQSQNRKATNTEVMALLKQWASDAKHSCTLRVAPVGKGGVNWVTLKGGDKNYDITALITTLARWHKSRQ